MSAQDLYCARSDVTKRMPIGSVTSSSGIVAETSTGANTFTFDGHGFVTDDPVVVRTIEGGSMPAPLVANTTYYAITISNDRFSLAATPGGPAIDITTIGDSMVIAREPDFNESIEFYSRWADTCLTPHIPVPLATPLTGQFALVKGLVADLCAKRELNANGKDSAVINAAELAAKAQLERFAEGLAATMVRGAVPTTSTNRAITNTIASTGDPRGWGSGSLP